MAFYKERYLHVNMTGWYGVNCRGFSVLISPCLGGSVEVCKTICSLEDNFSKKAAREALKKAKKEVISYRELPKYLERIQCKCFGIKGKETDIKFGNDFAWIWKYFL